MGLKFERSNDLDKLFDSFAVDPLKKEVPLEELAKQRQEVKKEEAKKDEPQTNNRLVEFRKMRGGQT